jgi:glycosyltransferase involved in cell wall biosynthesis
MKLISIITPVYNQEKFIGQTIASVVNQSYQNWEMLIVDDCSVDKSWKVIRSWAEKDSRIKIFRNKTNKGLIKNWKFLIDNSRGGHIAFLEGDDVFYHQNIKEKVQIFQKHPQVGMVYCNFNIINEKGQVIIADNHKKNKIKTFKNTIIEPVDFLFSRTGLIASYSQIMVKRDVILKVGYPRSLDTSAKVFLPSDWDFNFRIATASRVYCSDKILLGYRKHQSNSSANIPRVSKHLSLILDDYEKKFANNKRILAGINYQRGKSVYFSIIYQLENGEKKKSWKLFFLYVRRHYKNLRYDMSLNLKLIIRLFLPNKINSYIRKKYYGQ